MSTAVQGVPPGLTAVPLSGGMPADSTQVKGVPPGLTAVSLTGADETTPPPPGDGITNMMNDVYSGVTREGARTLAGIDRMVARIPGVGKALTTPLAGGKTSEEEIADLSGYGNAPDQNPVQSGGRFMETALEFLMGDEALKSLSFADKIKHVAPALKLAEKSPTIAKAIATAARTGTVSGVQSLAKTGGDIGEAAKQAAIGAVTGGVVEGAAGGLKNAIAAATPAEEDVAGETLLRPKNGAEPSDAVVSRNQTAGKNVIEKTAKDAAGRNVGLVNDRSAIEMEPGPGGAQGEPTGYRTVPKAPIVDVPAAVARVSSFGDAAEEVEGAAKRSYDVINAVTNDQFGALRDEIKKATKDVATAIGPEARDAAQLRLDNASARMDRLFADVDGQVSRQDWQSANLAWKNAKVLRQVHNAVESTFDTDAGFSQRSGTYRGFNGNMLRQNINRLTQRIGEPELNRVIGRENMDNLRKVAELTRTNADRAKFGAAVQQVSGWLVRHPTAGAGIGAVVGHFLPGVGSFAGAGAGVASEAAFMAARKVMQSVATNPRVGQQLTFALEAGARPEYYAPIIGKIIRDADTQDSEE